MRRAVLVVAAVLVLSGVVIRAHHGYADFFMDRSVTVAGEVQRIRWANPHVVLEIRAADSTVYTASFHQGASWFERREASFSGRAAEEDPRNNYFPLNRQTLQVGDRVVVVAVPPRDPQSHQLALIREVSRARDGWRWKRVGGQVDQATGSTN
jgi:uncharacterized protein DUF6152